MDHHHVTVLGGVMGAGGRGRLLLAVALLCVLGWLARAIYIYWPFLSGHTSITEAVRSIGELYDTLARQGRPFQSELTKEEFVAEYQLSLALWATLQGAGLIVSIAGVVMSRVRLRALLTLTAATLYLASWVWPGLGGPVSVFRAFEVKLHTAQQLDTWGGFALLDVALPLVFAAAFSISAIALLLEFRGYRSVVT